MGTPSQDVLSILWHFHLSFEIKAAHVRIHESLASGAGIHLVRSSTSGQWRRRTMKREGEGCAWPRIFSALSPWRSGSPSTAHPLHLDAGRWPSRRTPTSPRGYLWSSRRSCPPQKKVSPDHSRLSLVPAPWFLVPTASLAFPHHPDQTPVCPVCLRLNSSCTIS